MKCILTRGFRLTSPTRFGASRVVADNVQVDPWVGVRHLAKEVNKFKVHVLLVEGVGAEFPGQDSSSAANKVVVPFRL